MKRFYLLSILFLQIGFISATDYSKVDEQSHYVPFQFKTPVEIAKYLTHNLRSDEEKVRSIYFWIANTIRFDPIQVPGTDYRFSILGKRNFLKEVLDSHKGVCQHYAVLFDTLCRSVGIKSYFVCGYTRNNGQLSELSHAWNAVMLDGKYYDIDVTWSAGYIEDDKFRQEFHDDLFLVSPAKFISSHIPFDPVWQFLDNPVTHYSVQKNDFSHPKTPKRFNYSDSIKSISTRDILTNLISETIRIQKFGITNKLIQEYYYSNLRNIDLLRYNLVVRNFNQAIENFNAYMTSKSHQSNEVTVIDNKAQNRFILSRQQLEQAETELKSVTVNDEWVAKNITGLQNAITKLKKELENEEIILKKILQLKAQ